ncbi:fungal-specific transcription factor domain-containing protein [Ilyonectria sp. MPI-CAGE-AT-0026]|nr:fungal-specific transcription factor domain-containing protein [Ilyonectria sp. MPI-CAGE-AT-0026]
MASVARTSRRYGFACLPCRRKKSRCDGNKPHCRNCVRSGEDCAYKATDALVTELYNQLQHSEARVRELEDGLRKLAVLDLTSDDSFNLISSLVETETQCSGPSPPATIGSGPVIDQPAAESSSGKDQLQQAELSVDEHGEVQYFGATSRFLWHEEPSLGDANAQPQIDEDYHRKWLLSNSRFYASWEQRAYASLALDPEVSPEAATALLQMYWTWQGPLHNCVYKPCFFRDMALGGPYFSPFLLNVIYAHACRHVKADDARFVGFDRGEYFLAKAKLLLLNELGREKPRVPTIQGLLILGGRQCAVGKSSEGWLYTGMAIRMIKDLGLHLRKRHVILIEKLEPDDLEASKRLYLSAYAWDKSLSLCLGRPPSLTELPYDPSSILDRAGDEAVWRPLYLAEIENAYPGTEALSSLTFSWFCRLSILVNDLYNTVYNSRADEVQVQKIVALEERLRGFYTDLPEVLRISDVASLAFCPPPHIMCLNILYHTVLLLLYRPFFPWSNDARLCRNSIAIRAKAVCAEEAILVNDFFRAYGKTFKFQNQSYLISYCVYTAATIELQQIDDPDERISTMAVDRLATTLNMLETEARQTPGVRRSLDIIKLRLESRAAARTGTRHSGRISAAKRKDAALPPPSDGVDMGSGIPVDSDMDMNFPMEWIDWENMNPSGDFVPGIESWAW